MAKYTPKSKIIVKAAQPDALSDNFFTLSKPKTPYVGPYIETSDGRYFIGSNTINMGEELFKEIHQQKKITKKDIITDILFQE